MDFCIPKFVKLLIKSPKTSLAHFSPTVDRDTRPWTVEVDLSILNAVHFACLPF